MTYQDLEIPPPAIYLCCLRAGMLTFPGEFCRSAPRRKGTIQTATAAAEGMNSDGQSDGTLSGNLCRALANLNRARWGLRRALGGQRRALRDLCRAVANLNRARWGLRRALGGQRRAVGRLCRAVESLRRALRGLRRAVGGPTPRTTGCPEIKFLYENTAGEF